MFVFGLTPKFAYRIDKRIVGKSVLERLNSHLAETKADSESLSPFYYWQCKIPTLIKIKIQFNLI